MVNLNENKKKIIIKNNNNKGTNFFISRIAVCQTLIQNQNNNIKKYNIDGLDVENNKDKILLSKTLNFKRANTNLEREPLTLVTQEQLFNNIKYIYKNNNFSNPKLVFIKNKNKHLNSDKKYLFDDNEIETFVHSDKFLNAGFNFYKKYQNSDYFKFNFSDFDFINSSNNNPSLNVNVRSSRCNFNDVNSYSEKPKIFTDLYILNEEGINLVDHNRDTNIDINTDKNILIYNKDKNNTVIDLSFLDNQGENNYNLTVNFNLAKFKNVTSKYYGKILLNKEKININGYVIGEKTVTVNDSNIDFLTENNNIFNEGEKNKIFLSLGNGITGLTQDHFTKQNIKFSASSEQTKIFGNKIFFVKTTNKDYTSKKYLFDNSYNYDYTNKINIQKNEPKDLDTGIPIKKFDINLNDYIKIQDYSNNFTNLEILKFNENFNENYDITKKFYKIDVSNIFTEESENYIKLFNENGLLIDDFNLRIGNDVNKESYERYDQLHTFGDNENKKITNNLCYDFRYNYDKRAYLQLEFNIKYSLGGENLSISNELFNGDNAILNFNKFIITNFFETGSGSDFTNVNCIFRYHDPDNTPDASFRYPNNNIEILRDVNIDNLSKAIELLPNSRTGTSNSIFLPARNGSNLSRKMIQGYIGMNNIAKLLSIEPYDPTIINSRGFNNQLNFQGGTLDISDLKLTDREIVALKYESQKHSSQKNIVTSSRKNFANLVRQPSRSRNVNLSQTVQNCPTGISNVKKDDYRTPFTLFKTGRGNYLNSGK